MEAKADPGWPSIKQGGEFVQLNQGYRRARHLLHHRCDPLVRALKKRPAAPEYHLFRSIEDYERSRGRIEQTHRDWLRAALASGGHLESLMFFCATCGRWVWGLIEPPIQDTEAAGPSLRETLACPSCGLNNRMRALIQLLQEHLQVGGDAEIFLAEHTTPMRTALTARYCRLVSSEYLRDGTPPGGINAQGVRHEDLTALSFDDDRFDAVLSFEVFEHIADYQQALAESARVLRPGGYLIFSVPFHRGDRHTVRARLLADGTIEHLLPPEFHGDPIDPTGCLCFYHFGWEMLEDLHKAGFQEAQVVQIWWPPCGYLGDDLLLFVARR
ncbi:hypothetical protein BH23PLA1_BH23PLA1_43660 [soil metagenome]